MSEKDEQRTQDEKLVEDSEKSPERDEEKPDVEGHLKSTKSAQFHPKGDKPGKHF
jgi:hypothetical protein